MAEQDPLAKALRLFLYTPVGLAAYLMDSAPTFMELFVARGRIEVGKARTELGQRLGRSAPEAPEAPAETPLAQRLADGLGKVATAATQAGTMIAAVAGPVVSAATNAAASAASAAASTASTAATAATSVASAASGSSASPGAPGAQSATGAPGAPSSPGSPGATSTSSATDGVTEPSADSTAGSTGSASTPGAGELPIPGYDQLSASQIVEHLEGLSKVALDRIKLYELAHRARRTILATIDQLTA